MTEYRIVVVGAGKINTEIFFYYKFRVYINLFFSLIISGGVGKKH